MNRKDWLQDWLKDWAVWYESISGYADRTTVARLMLGQLTLNEFGTSVPQGIEPPSKWMRDLVLAMNQIMESGSDKAAENIQIVKAWYIAGSRELQQFLDIPSRTLYKKKGLGEQKIRSALRAMRES